MKYVVVNNTSSTIGSPSMRREWIEMKSPWKADQNEPSPSMRREWIEMHRQDIPQVSISSPSMRREWIEIALTTMQSCVDTVSLHAEGVD